MFVERSGVPQLVGSGVLVSIGNGVVLLSAAHVLDERHGGLFTLGTNGLVALDGEYLYSSIPAEGRHKDILDVGVVVLSRNSASAAQALAPLSVSDLDLDERTVSPATQHYAVVGYPASKAKPRRDLRRLTAEGFLFTLLSASAEEYDKFGVGRHSHLVLSFDPREMTTIAGPLTGC